MVLPSPGKELVLAQWKPFLHVLRTAFSHQLTMETTTANQRAKDGSALLYWSAALLNGHPYHPCFSTALLFQLGKMIAARNHTMSDALSVLCSVHCLVIIRLPTKKSNSKKSSSKPQKRFFPYHRAYVHTIPKIHILSEDRAKRDPTLTKIRKHEIIRNLLFTFKPFSPELLSFSRIFW